MSFPIIQQESPIQQLAQVLRRISERQQERRAQDEEIRRRDAYLQLAQQQQAGVERQRVQGQANTDRTFNYNVEQNQMNRTRQMEQDKIAGVDRARAGVRSGLPEDTRISDELADRGANDPMEVEQITGFARQQARPGLQGSATRAPRIGQYKGATVDPGTLSYNAPSGGAGGRGFTNQDRLMQAAIGGALEQVRSMEALEAQNPLNATIPNLTSFVENASRLPVAGGFIQSVAGPAGQAAMTPEQQQFQAMAGEFIHTYASSLPGRRLGPELLRVIHHNFFPRAGQTDPATIAEFSRRRREAADRMARAAYGEVQDLESLLSPETRAELDRVAPRESGAVPAQVGGRSVGIPAAGQNSPMAPPAAPRILPRYLNP